MQIKKHFATLYKGILIGTTMLIPGVSGGSMAIILGIYDHLVEAVSTFFHDIKKNVIFLVIFVLGAGSGMILLAKPLLSLVETYPKLMSYFFIGAVAGGIPAVYKQAQVKKFSWKCILYVLVGLGLVVSLSVFQKESFMMNGGGNSSSFLFLMAAGVIAAAALVLPGISVSYLLLMMGLYHDLMRAISGFDMSFLLPMGLGLLIGIILLTKGLEYCMKRYPQISYLTILGFVIGSLAEIFPGVPDGKEWIFCGTALAAGFYFIHTLSGSEGI